MTWKTEMVHNSSCLFTKDSRPNAQQFLYIYISDCLSHLYTGQFCETLLLDTLRVTFVRHPCMTLLWSTLVRRSLGAFSCLMRGRGHSGGRGTALAVAGFFCSKISFLATPDSSQNHKQIARTTSYYTAPRLAQAVRVIECLAMFLLICGV